MKSSHTRTFHTSLWMCVCECLLWQCWTRRSSCSRIRIRDSFHKGKEPSESDLCCSRSRFSSLPLQTDRLCVCNHQNHGCHLVCTSTGEKLLLYKHRSDYCYQHRLERTSKNTSHQRSLLILSLPQGLTDPLLLNRLVWFLLQPKSPDLVGHPRSRCFNP